MRVLYISAFIAIVAMVLSCRGADRCLTRLNEILMSESNVDWVLLWYRLHPNRDNCRECMCVCICFKHEAFKEPSQKLFIFLLSHFFYAHMCKLSVGEVLSRLG